MVAVAGERLTLTSLVISTEAVIVFVGSATLVASMVTAGDAGSDCGAVKIAVVGRPGTATIVPTVVLPPGTLSTLHSIPILVVFETLTDIVTVLPSRTDAFAGERTSKTPGGGWEAVVGETTMPEQPLHSQIIKTKPPAAIEFRRDVLYPWPPAIRRRMCTVPANIDPAHSGFHVTQSQLAEHSPPSYC